MLAILYSVLLIFVLYLNESQIITFVRLCYCCLFLKSNMTKEVTKGDTFCLIFIREQYIFVTQIWFGESNQ